MIDKKSCSRKELILWRFHKIIEMVDGVQTLRPKQIVPVHTEYPEDFSRMFDNVLELKDGEPFVVT